LSFPYREQRHRDFCQQPIALPVPDIDSDGREVSHRRCDRLAAMRCPRCGRPLCLEHRPASERRCDACESQFERSISTALSDALLLTPRHRTVRTALSFSLIATGMLLPWLTFQLRLTAGVSTWVLVLCTAIYSLALHAADPLKEDRAARRLQAHARQRFLLEVRCR